MTTSPPPAISAFIEATNAGDTESFLAAFSDDATLEDWGRVFSGLDGISRWNRSDNIGVHSHFDLVEVRKAPGSDTWIVVLTVTGDGFNGTGPMSFHLRDGLIDRLVISPT